MYTHDSATAGSNRLERIALVFTAVCCAAVFVSYLSNINSGPFEDDFGLVAMAETAKNAGCLSVWTDALGCFMFRPFNIGLLALALRFNSWAVVHATSLGFHVLISFVVMMFASSLFPNQKSRALPAIIGLSFFVHQASTATILQLDTVSESTSDFFSVIALLGAVRYSSSNGRALAVTVAASFLAMVGKESGISTPVVVVITVLLFASHGVRLRKLAVVAMCQAAIGLAYALWRLNVRGLVAIPEEAQSRYSMGVGLKTLLNLGQYAFVDVVPWNSASLLWNRRPYEWAIGIAVAVLIIVLASLGWKRFIERERHGWVVLAWLFVVFLVWSTPCIFMMKVSEHQAYRLTLLASIAFGFGVWVMLRSRARNVAGTVLVVWCLWVGIMSVGSIQKCELLKHNARVAAEMLEAMREALGDLSATKEIWVFLVPSRPSAERYSVLYVPDSALRWRATSELREYLRKPDLTVEFILPGHAAPEYDGTRGQLKKLIIDINKGTTLLVAD